MQQSSHAQPSDGYHAWFFDGCNADADETSGACDGGPEFELAEGPELERFKAPPPEATPSAARPRLRLVSFLDDAHEKKEIQTLPAAAVLALTSLVAPSRAHQDLRSFGKQQHQGCT